MARILSISYDESLLETRRMMLEREGYEVHSAFGFAKAIDMCRSDEFDLIIMGHSIPHEDKLQILSKLRKVCKAPVLALMRQGEQPLETAQYVLDHWEPRHFLALVGRAIQGED